MRALKLLIFLLTMLSGTAQLARHVYVRWVEQRASVLHRYEQSLATTIRGADSLAKLETQYATELKRARREAAARATEKRPDDGDFDPEAAANADPKVTALREAITDWEAKSNEIRELRYFWFVGLLALAAGAWAFRRGNEWFGISLYALAFSEMIWCTSPAFFGGAEREFARLLDQKILFTALALALLAAAWRWGSLNPSTTSRVGAA
jgi:hypothetical protein